MSAHIHLLSVGCVAIAVAFASGCSSTASPASATAGASSCGFSSAPPSAPSADASQYGYESDYVPQGTSVKSYVTAQALIGLDALIGSYLRGDSIVYTGTLAAHDDQSVLGSDCPADGGYVAPCSNQSISNGPAVASLTTSQGVASLAVHSVSQHKYVVFQQGGSDGGGFATGVTAVGLVLPDNFAGGNSGTCTGCAPSFANAPSTITFDNLVSLTEVPNLDASVPDASAPDAAVVDANTEALLRTYATASLTRATPCELTWYDLVELNVLNSTSAPGLGSFTLQGGEWSTVAKGNVETETASGDYCSVSYSLEVYVNASNLADYGVRNYQTFIPDAGYYENTCPQ
jgi:hypothetical protein